MPSEATKRLDPLGSSGQTTSSNPWFLEPADLEVPGAATGKWLLDTRDSDTALHHDERGVCPRLST